MGLTTDKNNECIHETKDNGQNECYLVLSEEEIAKGFISPLRKTYIHRGREVEFKGEIMTLEEAYIGNEGAKQYYNPDSGYAAFLKYPESELPLVGRYIKIDELEAIKSMAKYVGGCGASTTMHEKIAETYARDPKFYGATFCVGCGTHLPVNEFVWDGTDELLGS